MQTPHTIGSRSLTSIVKLSFLYLWTTCTNLLYFWTLITELTLHSTSLLLVWFSSDMFYCIPFGNFYYVHDNDDILCFFTGWLGSCTLWLQIDLHFSLSWATITQLKTYRTQLAYVCILSHAARPFFLFLSLSWVPPMTKAEKVIWLCKANWWCPGLVLLVEFRLLS